MAFLSNLKKPVLLDGGFATEEEKEGCIIHGDRLWGSRTLLDAPALVEKIHKKFLESGSQVILTNSYHAALPALAQEVGFGNSKARQVLQSSVTLARAAAEAFAAERHTAPATVAASIGPYSTNYSDASEYNGWYVDTLEAEVMIAYHYEQATCLLDAGAHVLAFETVPALAEARCIVAALERLGSRSFDAWISFSCKSATQLCHGETFAEAVALLDRQPCVGAVGINCTPPQFVAPLLQSAAHLTDKPLLVYPNSGEHFSIANAWEQTELGADTRELWQYIREWTAAGASAVGGCCRIYADDIRKMADEIKRMDSE